MTEGTRSSFCAAALKLPAFATATKARIEAIVSILHDSRKLNRRQAPFSVELARLASRQWRCTGIRVCGRQPSKRECDKENAMHNVSITPSPRTLRTEAQAAAALPAGLSGLEGVIHSLLLSALDKIVDRMSGASPRNDDQSRRPLAIAETDSSIESSVRSPAGSRETMLRVGSLELDLINRTAVRGDRPIDLLPSEFRLLKYMMQRGGQLLTRANLFQAEWHYKFLPETNLVHVHMGRLRRKVNGPNEASMIRPVRGVGFILSATPLCRSTCPACIAWSSEEPSSEKE